jgi:hypothetical protein
VLLTTAVALLDPAGLRLRMTGAARAPDGTGLIELVLLSPSSYLSSALYTCVMAAAFLRLWLAEFGDADLLPARGQSTRGDLVMLIVLQAIADMAFTLSLLSFMPLSAFVAAVTMGLMPAVLIEGRSWDAIGQSVQIAWPRILLFTLLWFFIVLPWVLSILIFDPSGAHLEDAGELRIWLAALGSDIAAPVFSTAGLCMTAVAYRKARDSESGGMGGDISDIFR